MVQRQRPGRVAGDECRSVTRHRRSRRAPAPALGACRRRVAVLRAPQEPTACACAEWHPLSPRAVGPGSAIHRPGAARPVDGLPPDMGVHSGRPSSLAGGKCCDCCCRSAPARLPAAGLSESVCRRCGSGAQPAGPSVAFRGTVRIEAGRSAQRRGSARQSRAGCQRGVTVGYRYQSASPHNRSVGHARVCAIFVVRKS